MFNPRWYQRDAVAAAWNHLCNRPGNPIIVLPTGAGKSLCIGMLCRDAVEDFKGRVFVLAHRKELLNQNAEKIRGMLQCLDVGIYSAGLNKRDRDHRIVLGGIQSVYNKAHEFGERNLAIIDEMHLVGDEGMYQQFLTELRQFNPHLRIVGLTATPFRTKEGKICRPDAIFQEICYSASIRKLIDEGFLSNLVTPKTDVVFDTSGLHMRGGEFIQNEMAQLFDDDTKIEAACVEIVGKTIDRKSILVFCPSVFHASKTALKIQQLTGEECGVVTGETPPLERSSLLSRFKSGSLKWLVNVDVLTTGFDAPNIDAIVILRATMSPGLLAQICGRGFRVCGGKTDCIILDFGENFKRHGPIDAEDFGQRSKPQGKGDGDAPTKTCPACQEPCPISARACKCGWKFPDPDRAKHNTNPDGSPIFEKDIVPTRWIVEEIYMSRHRKRDGTDEDPDTLRVDYVCADASAVGNLERKPVSEWVCLEHPKGYAQSKAALWWEARCKAPCESIDEAISLWRRGAVATPSHIETIPHKGFTRIVKYELDPKPESWADKEPQQEDCGRHIDAFEEAEEEVPF